MHPRSILKGFTAALLVSTALGMLSPVAAQEIPGITPTPEPTTAPRTAPTRITPPISYSLPSGDGSTPAPTPSQAAPPPVPVLPVPQPAPVPTQAAPPRPPVAEPPVVETAPAPAQPTEQAPVEVLDPQATVPAPAPEPTRGLPPVMATPSPQPVEEDSGWPWLIGVALALAAAGAIAFARRRSRDETEEEPAAPVPARDMPPPVGAKPLQPRPAAAPPPPAPRPATAPKPEFLTIAPKAPAAAIAIELVPHRAGMTILEGVVDFSLIVTNRGSQRAENMLLSAFLLTANAGQDDEIAELLAAPSDPRNHNPFALNPGEARRLDAGLTIPKAMIHAVQTGDRRVFVPLLVVGLRYRSGLTTGKRASAAFMVGRQRPGSERLGPLPFDGEPRMFEGLAARLHVPAATGPLRMAG